MCFTHLYHRILSNAVYNCPMQMTNAFINIYLHFDIHILSQQVNILQI